jgi:hypothetical protein
VRDKQTITNTAFIVVFITTTFLFHGCALVKWTQQLMGESEDGAKNFFTLAYHIKHSESFLWFDGMNYPYGEHVMYTDNQPLLAAALKMLNWIFPIADHLTFILPIILLFSFMLGAYFLFKILKSTGGPDWFSILASIGIIFLSPQWMRLKGHYSLTHGIIIPMMMFAAWKFYETRSKGWLAILPILAGFIHPYFLVMLSFFAGCYLLLTMVKDLEFFNAKTWGYTLLIPIAPLIVFQAFMWLTDTVSDRPEVPYGYLIYRATWPSVFIPLDLPHGAWFYDNIEGIYRPAQEGNFYVGAFGTLSALGGIVAWIFTKKLRFHPATNFTFIALIASIPILFLALGLPFTHWRFEHLLDQAGPLKQFRGIGRFAFVFFYALNLFAAASIAYLLKSKSKVALIVSAAALLVLFSEGALFSKEVNQLTQSGDNQFANNAWMNDDYTAYSAILPLPFYHTGSENFRTLNVMPIMASSMALSYASGLPLLSVQMSRTSLSQSLQTISLVKERLTPSEGLDENENWLLMVDPSFELSVHQKKLIAASSFIKEKSGYQLYDLPAKAFDALAQANAAEALALIDSSFHLNATAIHEADKYIFFNSLDMDSFQTNKAFNGKGCLEFDRTKWLSLLPRGNYIDTISPLELSFWVYAGDQHAVNTQIWYWERQGDNELHFQATEIGDHIAAIFGKWALVSYPILPHSNESEFEVLLHRDGASMNVLIDEILLKPVHLNVHKPGCLNINNRYYQPIEVTAVN